MKKMIIAFAACWLASHVAAAETAWLDSVPDAMEIAAQDNKLVLLDFTGSDWCGWCQKLVAETFSKPEFMEYARKNLILVELDFPMHKQQSADVRAANNALKKKYDVSGFPTLVALNANGTVLWKQTGYLPGGPPALIAELDKISPRLRGVMPKTPAPPVTAANPPAPAPQPAPVPIQIVAQTSTLPKVQGIFYSASHPTVVLDGDIYSEGDKIKGMKILKITPDKVTVEHGGQTEDLMMNKGY